MSEKKRVNERVLPLANRELATLLNPSVNHSLQGEVGELVRLVDAGVPEGVQRQCLHAGLWLLADDLGRAHAICQDIVTPYGSAWHAVVHRREGEFWNSKYWWRHAGGIRWEGLMERLRAAIPAPPPVLDGLLGAAAYDPARVVDLVESHAHRGATDVTVALVTVQRLEWIALFEACLDAA